MIPLEETSDEDFERHALAILQRELGLDGLARVLRVYRSGSGDYTRERHRWLGRSRASAEARRLSGTLFPDPHLAATAGFHLDFACDQRPGRPHPADAGPVFAGPRGIYRQESFLSATASASVI
jgi:hypothetical protein